MLDFLENPLFFHENQVFSSFGYVFHLEQRKHDSLCFHDHFKYISSSSSSLRQQFAQRTIGAVNNRRARPPQRLQCLANSFKFNELVISSRPGSGQKSACTDTTSKLLNACARGESSSPRFPLKISLQEVKIVLHRDTQQASKSRHISISADFFGARK